MSTSAQRARQREQRESTRREILAAADRFLRERPYRELSVDAVMAGSGLTRTAFYRHFDDLTDLVLRVFAETGRELVEIAEKWGAAAGVGYPAPALEGLRGIVDFFARNGRLIRAIAAAAATDERIEQAFRASRQSFIALATQTLDRLVEAGQLEVPDTGALARALTMMNEGYLLEEFGQDPLGDPNVALATLATVFLRVAGPQPSSVSEG